MKYVKLIFVFVFLKFLLFSVVFAKEVKPQVLVYGDNVEAFAAALQSARSGVPTLWVMPTKEYCSELTNKVQHILTNDDLVGGIWMHILEEVSLKKEKSDSLFMLVQRDLQPQLVRNALYKLVQAEKNLTLAQETKVTKLVIGEKNVEVVLSDKRKLKFVSAVDATEGMELAKLSKLDIQNSNDEGVLTFGPIENLSQDMIRTIFAIGNLNAETYGFTMKRVLSKRSNNLFFTSGLVGNETDENSFPVRINIAQAIGAGAAYCAFFKTTADKIDVRQVQTELFSFEDRFLPFVDVNIEDPNFNALQKMFLVNVLPFKGKGDQLIFSGADSVSVVSVRPVIQQLYSRAQLWFVDNKAEYFSTKDLIELLKVVSFRGDELDSEIQKGWNRRFKFDGEFNLLHTITRYEFAVLMDVFGSPFAKRVTGDGVIVR